MSHGLTTGSFFSSDKDMNGTGFHPRKGSRHNDLNSTNMATLDKGLLIPNLRYKFSIPFSYEDKYSFVVENEKFDFSR